MLNFFIIVTACYLDQCYEIVIPKPFTSLASCKANAYMLERKVDNLAWHCAKESEPVSTTYTPRAY